MKRFTVWFSALMLAVATLLPVVTAAAIGANLIGNPGFEISDGGRPAGWNSNSWGANNASFNYDVAGRTGRGVTTTVANYQSGDAKWYFDPVAVTAGKKYLFSSWYKSDVVTGYDAAITTTTGTTDYVWLGSVDPSANWKQQTLSFTAPANAKQVTIFQYLDKNGTLSIDDAVFAAEEETIPAPTPPIISLSAPAANAIVTGEQTIAANASDDQGVASVQFKLDGNNLGAADATAPYSINWDTRTVANGSHSLTAFATDTAGATATSAAVSVNVQNAIATPPPANNLVGNPSLETNNGALPIGWVADSWGVNAKTMTYENEGQDGAKSVKITMTSRTSGDAKWYFEPVVVAPGAVYSFSDYYKSNVDTEIDAMVKMADGSIQYYYMGTVAASPAGWSKVSLQFTAPANAASITIFHVIAKVGYLQTDNFSFAKYSPAQFNRALVSLTFDDGWRSIYNNGLPIMTKYGLPSTQYLNSEPVVGGWTDYMTYAMIKDFKAKGHELAWHTRSHADITKLTASRLTTELTVPSAFRSGTGTTQSTYRHFASPYGAYNTASIAAVRTYYASHRSTDVGYNGKDSLDLNNIKVQNITNTTTPADVQNWVNQAIATKSWLVIVYHEVDATPEDNLYSVSPTNLDAELNIIKQSGVAVKTVNAALAELQPQL